MPMYQRPNTPEDEFENNENDPNYVPDEGRAPAAKNAEDANWKDRYGNLRAHQQRVEKQLKDEIDNLRTQLSDATKEQIKLPKTPDEVKAWMSKYPDVAAIVETMILTRTQEQSEAITARIKAAEERELENKKENAKLELAKVHKDFFGKGGISEDDEFHEWLATKPRLIQDAIYVNDLDWETAAQVINMFKLETGYGKGKKPATNPADAARNVRTNSTPRTPKANNEDYDFTETQIAAMTGRELEINMDAIDKAQREGRIKYDIVEADGRAQGAF